MFDDKKIMVMAEPDIEYAMADGQVLKEQYRENPDITLVFGKDKTGRIVIKGFEAPEYYDPEVLDNYVQNVRKNNKAHNCKYCAEQEKRATEMLANIKKNIAERRESEQRLAMNRQPIFRRERPEPTPEPAPEPEPEYEPEPMPESEGRGFILGDGAMRRPLNGRLFEMLENRPRLFKRE